MNRQETLGGGYRARFWIADLRDVVGDMQTELHTSEMVSNFWLTFVHSSIANAIARDPNLGTELLSQKQMPLLNLSQEELAEIEKEEQIVYVPDIELSLLGKIFSDMQLTDAFGESIAVDEINSMGWVAVEKSTEAPNTDTTARDEDPFPFDISSGKRGMSLKTYIWASKANEVLTGRKRDQESISRLLGAKIKEGLFKGGFLAVSQWEKYPNLTAIITLSPEAKGPSLGARFERPL